MILAELSSLLSLAGAANRSRQNCGALPSTPDKAKILRRHVQSRWHKTGAGLGELECALRMRCTSCETVTSLQGIFKAMRKVASRESRPRMLARTEHSADQPRATRSPKRSLRRGRVATRFAVPTALAHTLLLRRRRRGVVAAVRGIASCSALSGSTKPEPKFSSRSPARAALRSKSECGGCRPG